MMVLRGKEGVFVEIDDLISHYRSVVDSKKRMNAQTRAMAAGAADGLSRLRKILEDPNIVLKSEAEYDRQWAEMETKRLRRISPFYDDLHAALDDV